MGEHTKQPIGIENIKNDGIITQLEWKCEFYLGHPFSRVHRSRKHVVLGCKMLWGLGKCKMFKLEQI